VSERQPNYEGKAKRIYATADPDIVLVEFKDDATAFNAQKRDRISGKGEANCAISAALFELLEEAGIATHYLDRPAPDRLRARSLQILPLEVIVRNIAAGSLCRQTGLAPGTVLPSPLVEFCYKNDELGDPLLTHDRLLLLELATPAQLQQIEQVTLQIERHLRGFFERCGIDLVDFKLEFGLDRDGTLRLGDELSPDTCRLWARGETDPNARVMDKDRFRHDLGHPELAYQQLRDRVLAQTSG